MQGPDEASGGGGGVLPRREQGKGRPRYEIPSIAIHKIVYVRQGFFLRSNNSHLPNLLYSNLA